MHRRTVIGLAGSTLASLAGCAGTAAPGTGADGNNQTPTESQTAGTLTAPQTAETETYEIGTTVQRDDGPAVTVEGVAVQETALYRVYPDELGVHAPANRWLVFADLSVSPGVGDPPTRDAFAVVADGESHGSLDAIDGIQVGSLVRNSQPYAPRETDSEPIRGWILSSVPAPLSAETVDVEWNRQNSGDGVDRVRWALSETRREKLARPPARFDLRSVEAPDSVPAHTDAKIAITVANTSDYPGTFRAALNLTAPLYAPVPIEISVSAGETKTATRELSNAWEDTTISFTLTWAGGSRERTVAVRPADAQTETATTSNSPSATSEPTPIHRSTAGENGGV